MGGPIRRLRFDPESVPAHHVVYPQFSRAGVRLLLGDKLSNRWDEIDWHSHRREVSLVVGSLNLGHGLFVCLGLVMFKNPTDSLFILPLRKPVLFHEDDMVLGP